MAGCLLGPSLLPFPISIVAQNSKENAVAAAAGRLWGPSPRVSVQRQRGAGTAPCYGCAVPPRVPRPCNMLFIKQEHLDLFFFKNNIVSRLTLTN